MVLPSPARPRTTGPLSRSEAARERPRSLLPFTAGAWLGEQTLWAPELQGPLPSSLVRCLWGAQPHLLATRQRLWPLEEASLQEAGKEAPQRARELVTNAPPTPTPRPRV